MNQFAILSDPSDGTKLVGRMEVTIGPRAKEQAAAARKG